MRKMALIAVTVCLGLFGLTACNGIGRTTAESYWDKAEKMESLEEYVKESSSDLDAEVLKTEALDSESNFSEKFKATAILCMMEYQAGLENTSFDGSISSVMFRLDYPESRDLANECLTMVTTDGEAFWDTMDETCSPYDFLFPMFAAADSLDGQTLVALLKDVPESSSYEYELEKAVDMWVKNNPGKLPEIKDSLMDIGYYDEWNEDDWRQTYFHDTVNAYKIEVDTIEEALAYMDYQRTFLIPELEEKFGEENSKEDSSSTDTEETGFYNTKLGVTVEQQLNLNEASDLKGAGKAPKTVGKKVIAFYRNLQTEEFPDSPSSLQVIGDFMLTLPEEEFPKTVEEADYYLVLTPSYEYGGYYQDQSGKDTKIREVYSSTSVDLYEADTGNLLYHIGNIMENASSMIFKELDKEALQYPELPKASDLLNIYHNINKPERYTTLLDHTSEIDAPLEIGKSIQIGNWEITYHSADIIKDFIIGIYQYTAKDDHQFVRGQFTVTNKGDKADTFLSSFSYGQEELSIAVTDSRNEQSYYAVDVLGDASCLSSSLLDPGETDKGNLLFEVPDEVIEEGSLFIVIKLRNQTVYYPVQ